MPGNRRFSVLQSSPRRRLLRPIRPIVGPNVRPECPERGRGARRSGARRDASPEHRP